MQFAMSRETASFGELIVVYQRYNAMKLIKLQPGAQFQCKLGTFRHEDMVGPLGRKIFDTKQEKYIYTLPISREIWAQALPLQTQILHRADKALIVNYLNILPGSIVIESGTGSGSLSTTLATSVLPDGKLFTFEFNEHRAEVARAHFADLGLQDNIVTTHRDVINNGFQHEDLEQADAIFLDLPSPWLAIPHTLSVLKSGGRLCNFSPCIEQVQRLTEALKENGYYGVDTREILLKPFVFKIRHEKSIGGEDRKVLNVSGGDDRVHTGYLTFAYKR